MASTVMQHNTYTKRNGKQVGSIAGWSLDVNNPTSRANKRRVKKLACQRRWLVVQVALATTTERVEELWFKACSQGHMDVCEMCEYRMGMLLG